MCQGLALGSGGIWSQEVNFSASRTIYTDYCSQIHAPAFVSDDAG